MKSATSSAAPNLQDMVLRLQKYWIGQGCLLLPACDFAIPFATLHPEAFLGVLKPGPWSAVFLQPIRRPLDGRFGQHPYRLGKHLQLQVVLKPTLDDIRNVYLESLKALGITLTHHDIRFSEWHWAPRSLGGQGSGWHALIDGLGVTRLTFLNRLADRDLDPGYIEISYGLERLGMALQGVDSAFRLDWTHVENESYAGLRQQDEQELSRYTFEVVRSDDLKHRLELLESEAERCLEAGLARASYELAVRCLEPIDQLEARGALTARERAAWLDRIRGRVVAAAEFALKAPALTKASGPQASESAKAASASAKQRSVKGEKKRRSRSRSRSKSSRAKGSGADS